MREKDRISNMIKIKIEQIQELWNNLHFEDRSSDFLSYKYFTQYFSSVEKITEEHFIIWSNFCYGWMPRMLTLKNFSNLPRIIEILNKAKNQDSLINIDELNLLKTSINNSIVWSSKLLHFINPKIYPIWDRRVGSYFWITWENKINNSKIYLEYTDVIIKFCEDYWSFLDEARKTLWNKMGYGISRVRAIEFILFQAGNTKNAK